MCRGKRMKRCDDDRNPILKNTRAKVQFQDLPEDVLSIILSELTLKDAVRISAVSSKLKRLWTIFPKLQFDAVTMCGGEDNGRNAGVRRQHVQRFIDNVNAVLKQHRGEVVEDLEVKYVFDSSMADHLDDWVRFAVSSLVKNLAFDLAPAQMWFHSDGYRFPLELLDSGSTSNLQHLQLRHVALKPPSQFSGLSNLRNLDLCLVDATGEDLQNLLSNCINLEWLRLHRCILGYELRVSRPLPNLLYLHIWECHMTKIELNAMKLKTFVYTGGHCPIDLGQAPDLKDADINFFDPIALEDVLTTEKPGFALPNHLPSVQNLTLKVELMFKTPWPLQNPCKFSQLKYLQLHVRAKFNDSGKMLSLASFLRAAPFVEKLVIHFTVYAHRHLDWESIISLPRCPHNYLKNLHITGFVGSTRQLELLLHTLENAPALEVFTVDPSNPFLHWFDSKGQAEFLARSRELARRYFDGRTSPHTKLCIL